MPEEGLSVFSRVVCARARASACVFASVCVYKVSVLAGTEEQTHKAGDIAKAEGD